MLLLPCYINFYLDMNLSKKNLIRSGSRRLIIVERNRSDGIKYLTISLSSLYIFQDLLMRTTYKEYVVR